MRQRLVVSCHEEALCDLASVFRSSASSSQRDLYFLILRIYQITFNLDSRDLSDQDP